MTILQKVKDNINRANNYKELALLVGAKEQTIRAYLVQLGIKYQGSGFKTSKTENRFLEDSDISNYWLGYIAADGCIHSKYNNISIKSKDVEHIKKLGKWLKGVKYYNSTSSVIEARFTSAEIKKYLIDFGITPVKSLSLQIKGKITWPFVRGIFDGDGNFRSKGGSAECKITSASTNMLNQLKEFFDSYNIVSRIRLQSKGKNPCYAIYISGHDFVKFYQYLYTGADVFLERKHLSMWPVFENRRGKLGELLENPAEDNQQPS